MKSKAILISIIIFGLVLRLFLLGSRPLGFTWDEAALGYNAYSLLLTGRDEHKQFFPIVFKSFGDYKPGLYVYLTIPSVKLFGLNEFATRLPSAIVGTLLMVVIYLLTKNLFAPFLLAINPWAIHFSRGAWEANVALFLTTFATLLFLRRKYLTAALFFGLTFLTYQGAKLFTPLLIVSLIFIYRPQIKNLLKPFLLLLLFLLPILVGLGSQSGRLKVFNVFNYVRSSSQTSEILRQDQNNGLVYVLFHSELLDQTRGIVERYLNHFSLRYLFIQGDWSNPRHSTPFYGYMHIPEILTLIIGLIILLRTNNKLTKLLLVWLILAPIPAALSRDIVSGVRALPMLVPLIIISGIGLSKIFSKKLLILLYFPALLLFFVYFLDLYFVHYPYYFAKYWLSPYKQAINLVNNNISSFKRVVFTDTLGQPYIFVLFYNRINPREFWLDGKFVANRVGDVGQVISFGKYSFGKVDWPAQRGDTSTIFIGNQYELPEQDMNPPNLVRLGELYYPDGSHALRLIGLK